MKKIVTSVLCYVSFSLYGAAMEGRTAQERFNNALNARNFPAAQQALRDLPRSEQAKNARKLRNLMEQPDADRSKSLGFFQKSKKTIGRLFGKKMDAPSTVTTSLLETPPTRPEQPAQDYIFAANQDPSAQDEGSYVSESEQDDKDSYDSYVDRLKSNEIIVQKTYRPGPIAAADPSPMLYALLHQIADDLIGDEQKDPEEDPTARDKAAQDAIALAYFLEPENNTFVYSLAKITFFNLLKKKLALDANVKGSTVMKEYPAALREYFDNLKISLEDYLNQGFVFDFIFPQEGKILLDLRQWQLSSLEGLRLIPNIDSITDLIAPEGRLTDLTEEIGNLTSLRRLDVYDNNLSTLPESLATLKQIEEVDTRENVLTSLPKALQTDEWQHKIWRF